MLEQTATTEWKAINTCPNCGANTGIKGTSGVCRFCGSELTANNIKVTRLPSDLPPGDFLSKNENGKQTRENRIITEIAMQFLPPQEMLQDPLSYFDKRADHHGDLKNPEFLSQQIDRVFEHCQQEALESARMFVQEKKEPQKPVTESFERHQYAVYMRLGKWLESQQSRITTMMAEAEKKMVTITYTSLGGGSRDMSPMKQLEDGYNPEFAVKKLVGESRKSMIQRLNDHVLWAGGEGEWKKDRRSGQEFHPRFLDYLQLHISELPAVNLDEIRGLVGDLNKNVQSFVRKAESNISGAVNYMNEDVHSTDFANAQDQYMTKADRLLELLFDEEVFPFVSSIFEKRLTSTLKKDLPEWLEFQANRNDTNNSTSQKWWEEDTPKQKGLGLRSIVQRLRTWGQE